MCTYTPLCGQDVHDVLPHTTHLKTHNVFGLVLSLYSTFLGLLLALAFLGDSFGKSSEGEEDLFGGEGSRNKDSSMALSERDSRARICYPKEPFFLTAVLSPCFARLLPVLRVIV